MNQNAVPGNELTSRELLKLARRIERDSRRRRELLKRVAELEGSIREARRLFRQLADQLGVEVEPPSKLDAGSWDGRTDTAGR
jgi:hypothetical protein